MSVKTPMRDMIIQDLSRECRPCAAIACTRFSVWWLIFLGVGIGLFGFIDLDGDVRWTGDDCR